MRGEGKGIGGGRKGLRLNLRIFNTEILLYELARELDQDLIGPVIRVPEQVYRDITITEL
jgi:hypothetical protein